MSHVAAPAYMVSANGNITVKFAGQKPMVANSTHVNYAAIKAAIKAKAWKKLPKLFDVSKAINRKGKRSITVKNGQVYCDGQPCNNRVVDRVVQFMKESFDFAPLIAFLRKAMKNPAYANDSDVNGLFEFVEANDLPLTKDGFILCYRRVRNDFKDFHSGKFDNSVGKTVEMPRGDVTFDRSEACSAGLHVASLNYARDEYHSGEGRLVVVLVDPADVVSVPFDYSCAKCRVCKYKVLEELKDFYKPLSQGDYTEPEEDDDDNDCDTCGEDLDDCTCEDDDYNDE